MIKVLLEIHFCFFINEDKNDSIEIASIFSYLILIVMQQ